MADANYSVVYRAIADFSDFYQEIAKAKAAADSLNKDIRRAGADGNHRPGDGAAAGTAARRRSEQQIRDDVKKDFTTRAQAQQALDQQRRKSEADDVKGLAKVLDEVKKNFTARANAARSLTDQRIRDEAAERKAAERRTADAQRELDLVRRNFTDRSRAITDLARQRQRAEDAAARLAERVADREARQNDKDEENFRRRAKRNPLLYAARAVSDRSYAKYDYTERTDEDRPSRVREFLRREVRGGDGIVNRFAPEPSLLRRRRSDTDREDIRDRQRTAGRGGLGAATIDTLAGGADKIGDAFAKAGKGVLSFRGLIVAAIAAIGPLTSIIAAAIPVLLALGNTVIAAGGAFALLPSLIGAAVQGVGTLVAILGPVAEAFKLYDTAQKASTKSASDATKAAKDQRRAQRDLNDARKEAIRNLQDLQDAVDRAGLDEEGAILNLRRARADYRQTIASPDSSVLDVDEAAHRVKVAEQDLTDVRKKATRNVQDLNQAQRDGVEGSKQVVAAREALATATANVSGTTTAAVTAQEEYQAALAKMGTNTRRAVIALIGFRDGFKAVQKAASEAFFGRFSPAQLAQLGTVLATLREILTKTAGTLGGVFSRAFDSFVARQQDLKKFGDQNNTILDKLGTAAIAFGNGLLSFAIAASPALGVLLDKIIKIATNFQAWSEDAGQSGIPAFFDVVNRRIGQLLTIAGNLFGLFKNLFFDTDAYTGGFLDAIIKITDQWEKWSEKQSDALSPLQTFLADTKEPLKEIAATIGAIVTGIVNMGGDKRNLDELTRILTGLREDVLPGIERVFNALSDSELLSNLIESFGTLLDILGDFLEHGGQTPITVIAEAITFLAKALHFLVNIPGVTQILFVLATGLSILAGAAIIGKFTGLFALIRGIRSLKEAAKDSGGIFKALRDRLADVVSGNAKGTAAATRRGDAVTPRDIAGGKVGVYTTQLNTIIRLLERIAGGGGGSGSRNGGGGGGGGPVGFDENGDPIYDEETRTTSTSARSTTSTKQQTRKERRAAAKQARAQRRAAGGKTGRLGRFGALAAGAIGIGALAGGLFPGADAEAADESQIVGYDDTTGEPIYDDTAQDSGGGLLDSLGGIGGVGLLAAGFAPDLISGGVNRVRDRRPARAGGAARAGSRAATRAEQAAGKAGKVGKLARGAGIAGIAGLGLSLAADSGLFGDQGTTGKQLGQFGGAVLGGAGIGATIGSVIPGVGTAIGGVVGGLAGGAYSLYKDKGLRDKTAKFFADLGDGIADISKDIAGWIAEHVSEPIFRFFKSIGTAVLRHVKLIGKGFVDNVYDPIVRFFTAISRAVTGVVRSVSGFVYEHLIRPFLIVFVALGLIVGRITAFVAGLINDYLIQPFLSVFRAVSLFVFKVVSAVAGFINDYVVQPVIGFFRTIYAGFVSIVAAVGSFLTGYVLTPVRNFFVGLYNGFVGVLGSIAGFFTSYVIQPVLNFFTAIGRFFANLPTLALDLLKKIPGLGAIVKQAASIVDGKQSGGLIGGTQDGTVDRKLIWITPGEYVVRQRVTNKPWARTLLDDLNNDRLDPSAFYAGLNATPAMPRMPAVDQAGIYAATTTSSVVTNKGGFHVGGVTINNPVPERSDRSLRRTLQTIAYLHDK